MSVPWYMLSPSPVSLIQYAVLTWIGSRYLRKRIDFKYPKIMNLVQSFTVVAFFVVFTDAFWAGFQALKFVPMFPQDANQILFSFARDILASFLFIILIIDHFRSGVLSFDVHVLTGLLLSLGGQAVWFLLAPNPAFTDYTFAWRNGYPVEIVLQTWIISHWIMRLPLWGSIIVAFQHGRKPEN